MGRERGEAEGGEQLNIRFSVRGMYSRRVKRKLKDYVRLAGAYGSQNARDVHFNSESDKKTSPTNLLGITLHDIRVVQAKNKN